jgi:hypothetical protein
MAAADSKQHRHGVRLRARLVRVERDENGADGRVDVLSGEALLELVKDGTCVGTVMSAHAACDDGRAGAACSATTSAPQQRHRRGAHQHAESMLCAHALRCGCRTLRDLVHLGQVGEVAPLRAATRLSGPRTAPGADQCKTRHGVQGLCVLRRHAGRRGDEKWCLGRRVLGLTVRTIRQRGGRQGGGRNPTINRERRHAAARVRPASSQRGEDKVTAVSAFNANGDEALLVTGQPRPARLRRRHQRTAANSTAHDGQSDTSSMASAISCARAVSKRRGATRERANPPTERQGGPCGGTRIMRSKDPWKGA